MTELLLALSLITQNPTVTIPIDPAKLLAQVPINTTFTDASGVKWELKGTLIARPISTPAPSPPASATPLINAYRDLDGAWITEAKAGQRFLVLGEGFGAVAGSVSLAASEIPALSWSDGLIVAEAPALTLGELPVTFTVRREDGAHYTGLAFRVTK